MKEELPLMNLIHTKLRKLDLIIDNSFDVKRLQNQIKHSFPNLESLIIKRSKMLSLLE
jgi:hypothetical protein